MCVCVCVCVCVHKHLKTSISLYIYKHTHTHIHTHTHRLIGPVGRVFANGPGDLGSIPGRVIPKTLKRVLDTSLINIQQIRLLSRVKRSNPGKGVAPSPTPRCSSYRKGSLLVALDYGRQLYLCAYLEREKEREKKKDRVFLDIYIHTCR